MTQSYFVESGGSFFLTNENQQKQFPTLPVGNYSIKQNPITKQFYLERVEDFTIPSKVYGNSVNHADRIVSTYLDRSNNTGVLLAGEKGSGKTLEGRLVSIKAAELGIPTIIIGTPFFGDQFNQFIQSIHQNCILFFDEFEKVYDREGQEALLTLLDGVFQTKKLILFTCNDKYKIDKNMLNRPGRIYYFFEYDGLEQDFIEEYCKENLKNNKYVEAVSNISYMFKKFNFDMLKAIVEECNRYNESPIETVKYINVKLDTDTNEMYSVEVYVDDKLVSRPNEQIYANPFSDEDSDLCFMNAKDHKMTYQFTSDDLTYMNIKRGEFIYLNKNQKAILKKLNTKSFDITNGYNMLSRM